MSGTRTETPPTTELPVVASRPRFDVALVDVVIVVALGAFAFIVRRHVPADGLFYDDAWQALGAWKGSFAELITVGQTQPGFTAGLMVWTRVFGVSTASLITPALIAGTVGPPAIYLGLRWLGAARSIAFLLGAALSSAQVHIIYSYHVKTYTFDVLIVLGLALAVGQLARRHWQTSTAVGWFAGSVVVGSFSSIALIGTSVAGLILVLHSSDDWKRRIAAVAAQLVVLAALYFVSSRTYNDQLIRGFFAPKGGYIDFNPNPLTFGREVFNHFWHVADVFPGGRPTLSLALAGVGLLVAAWRGPLAVPARFLGLMVVVALAGSVLDQIPFGPPRFYGRVSLWLVPALALGLSATLELVRRQIGARATLRVGFDTIVCVAALVVLISSLGTAHPYPAGARSAVRQVMASAGPRDAVLITRPTTYSFALYANTPVNLRPTPDRSIGFLPVFSDDRLHPHDFTTTPEEMDVFLDGVDQVYVVHANVDPLGHNQYLFALAVDLSFRGFERESSTAVRTAQVDVWRRKSR